MMDVIAAHRTALADALAELSPSQWQGASLCTGWTPAHVLAHQTMPFRVSEQDFMAGMQRCGGDFTRLSNEIADRDSKIPPAELVALLRDNAENPWSPPGGGLSGALSHDVIHGLDMTWLLDLNYDIPVAAMTAVLTSITTPLSLHPDDALAAEVRTEASGETLFGFPLAGLRIMATDVGWSVGKGAELTGSSRDVLPLLAGRSVPRERFRGDGVELAWAQTTR
jgi:uncharacterized protein (TIGR03083 family)